MMKASPNLRLPVLDMLLFENALMYAMRLLCDGPNAPKNKPLSPKRAVHAARSYSMQSDLLWIAIDEWVAWCLNGANSVTKVQACAGSQARTRMTSD
eukprot:5008568-Amphidinium_carterae.1